MISVETFQKERRDARALVNGVRYVLDQLSLGGSRIDIDQEVAVERMILSIRPDDRPLHIRLAELLARIGPVVCKNPEQQILFQNLAVRQTKAQQEISSPGASATTVPHRPPAPVRKEKVAPRPRYNGDPETDRAVRTHFRKKRRSSLILIIALSMLVAMALVFVALISTSVPTPPSKIVPPPEGEVSTPAPTDTGILQSLKVLLGRRFTIPL